MLAATRTSGPGRTMHQVLFGTALLTSFLGGVVALLAACCAPVLAGVVVLTGATASFGSALAVSVTYVAGMVAPMAVLALAWEGRDWGSSRLLSGRKVRLGVGRFGRVMPLGTVASGLV